MLRRWGSAFVLSIAVHVAVAGGVVGAMLWNGLTFSVPIDVDVVGMRMDEVHDLPLGPPPGAPGSKASGAPRARKRVAKAPAADGELAAEKPAKKDEAGAEAEAPPNADAAAPRVSRLEQYGPEGSRVTALLRLDRLRGTPYVPALDAILGRLPDRRDLLDGTGLDLFQAFDALLIATPNPLDSTVTFLAARHRLKDAELRAALDRGARATGRSLDWRTEGRRPFAERHGRHAARGVTRDDRLIVLPAPGLVVVTPPVYRPLLLAMARPHSPVAATGARDAGAGEGGTATAVVAEPVADPGTANGAVAHEADGQWGALLRRIDAEDGIMPEGAVAMISATDLFGVRNLARGVDPGSRAGQSAPGGKPARQPTGTIAGMEVPRVITVSIGVEPSPILDVVAEFDDEDQARHWERDWPALHHRLATNPYVMLTGFGALVARAELSRSETTIHLREAATDAETLRLLQIVARFMGVEPIASP
jgi:hypothetical protein